MLAIIEDFTLENINVNSKIIHNSRIGAYNNIN